MSLRLKKNIYFHCFINFFFTFAGDMKTKLLMMVAILSIGSISSLHAQSDVEVSLKTDFVSDYNWRGLDRDHGVGSSDHFANF